MEGLGLRRRGMPRLGSLGITGPEARDRLKFLIDKGLKDLPDDFQIEMNDKARGFIRDMMEALEENESFEPTYSQVTYAQDLFDRYIL